MPRKVKGSHVYNSPIHQRLKIGPQSPARKRHTSQRLSERHIQETCRDFLALDGWRLIITDMPRLRGLGVQEPGMADDFYIRYQTPLARTLAIRLKSGSQAQAEVLIVEYKAKNGVAGQKQKEWQLIERSRGALVWVAKEDFPPTIEGFQEYYRASGLMRSLR